MYLSEISNLILVHTYYQSISENNHTDRCISLCNINIGSTKNKMEFLETSLNDFDILVVTETHLDNSRFVSEYYPSKRPFK